MNNTLKFIPPYFANYQHDACWQCSLRTILGYFEPNNIWTEEALDKLTGKEPGGTWAFKTCSDIQEHGYEVKVIGNLDFSQFAENPEKCIRNFYKEGVEWQLENTNLSLEGERAKKASEITDHEIRNFTSRDIQKLLNEGYLIITWVDSRKLYYREGNVGHFVCVYDIDEKNIIFHDSGGNIMSAQKPACKVEINHFIESCKDGDNMEGLFAFRKKEINHA